MGWPEIVWLTHDAVEKNVRGALDAIAKLPVVKQDLQPHSRRRIATELGNGNDRDSFRLFQTLAADRALPRVHADDRRHAGRFAAGGLHAADPSGPAGGDDQRQGHALREVRGDEPDRQLQGPRA